MMLSNSLKLCVCMLGILLWWNPPVYAQPAIPLAQPTTDLSTLVDALAEVDVVYFGGRPTIALPTTTPSCS
ncbi:MAG: hypothetical protein HC881_16675 [Leptolyngbyaceae cyanobacterium SL_7_1]|nr:hypothetical protein [Leptolyngbyaceae cyanobacterium SL_7_1]